MKWHEASPATDPEIIRGELIDYHRLPAATWACMSNGSLPELKRKCNTAGVEIPLGVRTSMLVGAYLLLDDPLDDA